MIAYWMLYSLGIGLLLCAGAAALEAALRPLGRATRWTWAAAMALSIAIPAAARFVPHAPAARAPAAAPKVAGTPVPVTYSIAPAAADVTVLDLARLDRPISLLWAGSSAGVVAALAAMAGVLAWRRRRWTMEEVDGVAVLLSGDTGPAVIGLVRSRIVLPRWAVAADPEARSLVLRHEQEHVRAGDPRLLAAGLLMAAVTPWNPAVWWQLQRLRLAVEVDCDARVLRRRGDVRAYGEVLLEVGRRAVHTRLPAAAFSEPASSLERRIRIMTAPRVRRPLLRAAWFGALAAALVAAACEAPQPLQPSVQGSRRVYAAEPTSATHSKFSVQELVNRYYPEVQREGLAADRMLAFVLSPDGEVLSHEVLRTGATAGHGFRALDGRPAALNTVNPNTIAAIDILKQRPGQLGPTGVNVMLVQLKAPGDTTSTAVRHVTVEEPTANGYTTHGEMRRVSVRNGLAAAADAQPTTGAPTQEMLYAAMQRFRTPEIAAVNGDVRIEYTVDAAGKPQILSVNASRPELEGYGRRVVESMSFPGAPAGKRAVVWFSTGGHGISPERMRQALPPGTPSSTGSSEPAPSSLVAAVLSGHVTTAAGAPAAGMVVRIPELSVGAVTRDDGSYLLVVPGSALVTSRREVTAVASGAGAASASVTLYSGIESRADFVLPGAGR